MRQLLLNIKKEKYVKLFDNLSNSNIKYSSITYNNTYISKLLNYINVFNIQNIKRLTFNIWKIKRRIFSKI